MNHRTGRLAGTTPALVAAVAATVVVSGVGCRGPQPAAGTVTVAAEPVATDALGRVAEVLDTVRPDVRVRVSAGDAADVVAAFCSGAAGAAVLARPLTDGERAACRAGGVRPERLPLATTADPGPDGSSTVAVFVDGRTVGRDPALVALVDTTLSNRGVAALADPPDLRPLAAERLDRTRRRWGQVVPG